MSLKLKALLQLVGLVAFAAGVSLSIDWVFATFPRENSRNRIWSRGYWFYILRGIPTTIIPSRISGKYP